MDANIYRILYEVENNIQWIATSTYNYSFREFTQSTDTPYNLALAFLANYERPADPNQPARGTQAEYWYEFLGGLPPIPTIIRKKKKFPWAVLTRIIKQRRTFFLKMFVFIIDIFLILCLYNIIRQKKGEK